LQTSEILASIDQEISRLQQVRNLLSGNGSAPIRRGHRAAVPAASFQFGNNDIAKKRRRKISAEGRARIAAAQKARWAKLKKAKTEKK
jgi:hypothetical protein